MFFVIYEEHYLENISVC